MSKKMLTQEEFAERMRIRWPNIQVLGRYAGASEPVEVECRDCGQVWSAAAGELCRRGHRCRRDHKRFVEELMRRNAKVASGDVVVTGRYVDSTTKVACRCNRCGWEWEALPWSLLKGSGCAKCAVWERAARRRGSRR